MKNLTIKVDVIKIDLENVLGLEYCTVDDGALVIFKQKPFVAITPSKKISGFRINVATLARSLGLKIQEDKISFKTKGFLRMIGVR